MEKTSSSSSLSLNLCHVMKTEMIINRVYMLFLGIALIAWFYYYRTTDLISQIFKPKQQISHLLPHLLIFLSELLFVFLWVLHQANRWRPVRRTVFPDRLARGNNDDDNKFPAVDVFVCTADPGKEPSLGVMNTVISAMSLDYPPDKLSVYLSDDGGSFVTLRAMKEAWRFSKWWVPFVRKYGQAVKIGCPEAYFSGCAEESDIDEEFNSNSQFMAEKMEIKKRYNEFKESLEMNSVNAGDSVSRDHKPTIEVICDEEDNNMPLLVYVAREKSPSHPHNFKAGALNTLIRVSAVMSNAPYILVLDCDHYCNDPSSARQAMCFYLDPQISSKLAFVMFPQKFHNMSDHDIYDGRLNYYWRRILGLDGIQGPYISGCNMYLKRVALYGNMNIKNGFDLNDMKKSFGSSNEFIKSTHQNYKSHNNFSKDRVITGALGKEVQLLATCTYDNQTQWGTQVGFIYFSVVEDISTSLYLHRQGWISVFIDPPRPCFLGSSPTSLSDLFFQHSRWGLGLMQISLSKYCSLLHIGRAKISTLQCMSYASLTFDAIYVVPFLIVAIIPQICLLHRIPLYPKVSDPCFVVFAFIFLVSQLKHAQEVVFYGDSIRTTLYELRVWMMKSASCYLYATLDAFLYKFGLQNANFNLTSKVVDDEQETRFKKGIYDFQGSPMLIAPICSLYILNLASFALGVAKMIHNHEANELFVQAFIPFFGIIVNYQVFEGMFLREDKGRISPCVIIVSLAIATFILCFGSLALI